MSAALIRPPSVWRGTGQRRADATSPAQAAAAIASMAERLSPNWTRPEEWHEAKAEVIRAARALARRLDQESPG